MSVDDADDDERNPEAAGDDAARVQVLFASLDPARDTQELLAQYVPQFNPSFVGLRGDEATTAAMARSSGPSTKVPGATPATTR